MSSSYVRSTFLSELTAGLPTVKFLDISGVFDEMEDFLAANSVTMLTPWVGLEYIGNDEIPITINSYNNKGKYRETGVVSIYIVDVAKLSVGATIVTRAETIRNFLRGRRFGNIIVTSVSPVNFGGGAGLNFEGGWTSGMVNVAYENEVNL